MLRGASAGTALDRQCTHIWIVSSQSGQVPPSEATLDFALTEPSSSYRTAWKELCLTKIMGIATIRAGIQYLHEGILDCEEAHIF